MIEIRHSGEKEALLSADYDKLYSEAEVKQHWASFFTWILDLIQPHPGKSLLDVACGTGLLLKQAQARNIAAIGIDFSATAVIQAQKHSPALVSNGEKLPFANRSFDYVVNLGSLEHFEDMAKGVQEMARVLKPDGKCCILVPNTFGLLWTIWHAKNTGEIFDDGQPLQRYGTHAQWRRLLEENGLKVQRTVAYELPPPRTLEQFGFFLRHPKIHLTKLLLWRLIPLNLASMFVFLCERQENKV